MERTDEAGVKKPNGESLFMVPNSGPRGSGEKIDKI